MLLDIRIRGLGVISDAVLEFGPGLTVVTGETGAGKTMVVSGLALLFGGRADLSRLRPGVEAASVEGRLAVASKGPVAETVIDAGGELDVDARTSTDSTLILRRVLSASGRSRAVAGGASVPAALLARLATDLVVVHGQSDQFRLIQPAEQRATLDRYAGIDLTACRAGFARWQDAQSELDRRLSGARELAREADLLRSGLAEIDAAKPLPGEDVELAQLSERLQHIDALRLAATSCHDALSGEAAGDSIGGSDVQSLLATARHAADMVSGTDARLDELAARVNVLATDAADIAAEFTTYLAQLDADPDRLSEVFSRRAVLASLIRKYGPDVAAVLEWAAAARQRLAETDTSAEMLAELVARRDEARMAYSMQAGALSKLRQGAATDLSNRVTGELAGLGMATARVQVSLSRRPVVASQPSLEISTVKAGATQAGAELVGAGPDGIDDVEIALQAHPDGPALPIQRGASGGELSRVMLAIEVVLAGSDPVPTMVFDEVDAGVGGRAAVEIGRRLATLSRSHQVIVVTHLAQVAAFADHHLVVDKLVADVAEKYVADQHVTDKHGADENGLAGHGAAAGVTHSDIRRVTGDARVAELARMLAGDDTPVAREHAAELLHNARSGSSEHIR